MWLHLRVSCLSKCCQYCNDYGNKKCTCPAPPSSSDDEEDEEGDMPTKKEMQEAAALAAALLSKPQSSTESQPQVVPESSVSSS